MIEEPCDDIRFDIQFSQPIPESTSVQGTAYKKHFPMKVFAQLLNPKLLADRPTMCNIVQVRFSFTAN
ncbi:MAG: hypothetical protein ABSF17_09425 [Terracidiphilus sp.]|jgi:hypothetical protein